MAVRISTATELFHKFHTCELYVKQGKIATCLMAFKQIIESMVGVPLTEKEKKELDSGIETFLKNLSGHKKFQEIFGDVKFGDTDLATNLEFIKSMIVAQEEEIVGKVAKDEEAAEAQRLDMEKMQEKKKEETQSKIEEVIKLINADNLPKAMELIGKEEAMRDAVILHFNSRGMEERAASNLEEAVKCYVKALSVSPEDENLHYNVGRAYFEDGKTDKAEDHLAQALKINPDFKEGKLFHEYLLKVKKTKEESSGADSKIGGLLKKIFSHKK